MKMGAKDDWVMCYRNAHIYSRVFTEVPEQHAVKTKNQGTTEYSHIGH
jgi:hypothetical protein